MTLKEKIETAIRRLQLPSWIQVTEETKEAVTKMISKCEYYEGMIVMNKRAVLRKEMTLKSYTKWAKKWNGLIAEETGKFYIGVC